MTPSEYLEQHDFGEQVIGKVISCHQYGCVVRLEEKVEALLEIIDFIPENIGLKRGGPIRIEDLPRPGEEVRAYLYAFSPKTAQIRLTMWEHKIK
jgi:ribosomal protein S1